MNALAHSFPHALSMPVAMTGSSSGGRVIGSIGVATGSRKLGNLRQHWLLVAKLRVLWVLGLFALVGCCALLRILFLGVTGPSPRQVSLGDLLIPARGEIVDRNNVALARDFRVYSLRFNPKAMTQGTPLVHTPEEVADSLLRLFPDLDRTKVLARLRSGKAGTIRRQLLPEEANAVHDLGEPALEFPLEGTRYYPQGSLAAHILGYVDSEGHGKVGMEEAFDKQLTSEAGRTTPSVLSIDFRVQSVLEDELARGMAMSQAKGAAGIVLDVDTGEVLALASLPSFDPNHVQPNDMVVTPEAAKLGEVPRGFNRATNQVYELGSTFKPITVAAALDAGVITDLGRRWPAHPLHVGRFTIKDSHAMGASLNAPETLIHSSNVVTAQIADELGGARLKRTLETLGMNARPTIELPARGFPIWDKGNWSRLRTMTVSYGHGVAVTPLHLASAYAALVNGGIWRPATLRKLDAGQVPAGRRVFTAATSARMRQLLRMIVSFGTGRSADATGFRVGGKTGSAEKPGVGGYRHHSLISTFAAAFPMDKPRYVVIAMMDEPQGTQATSFQRTAAFNAAPAVGRIIPRIGPLLKVMPDQSRDVDISDLKPLIPHEVSEAEE